MRKYVPVPLLLAGLVLFSSGCKMVRPKPVKFNNSMARANSELAALSKAFFKTFEDFYTTGSTAKLRTSDVRSAYESTEKRLNDIVKNFDEMKPPIKQEGLGQDFLNKYKAFLGGQKEILDKMKEIVRVLEDNSLPPNVKHQRVTALVGEIGPEERKHATALQSAQGAFAKELNLIIQAN